MAAKKKRPWRSATKLKFQEKPFGPKTVKQAERMVRALVCEGCNCYDCVRLRCYFEALDRERAAAV